MPSIAQKLCRDIVDPLKSSNITTKRKSFVKSVGNLSKEISNDIFVPNRIKSLNNVKSFNPNSNSSNIVTIIKSSVIHRGVNTLVTGPLKCDSNCVTLAQSRNKLSTCKCAAKKEGSKIRAKEIQTKSRKFIADKACAQCIETANFSNQFLSTSTKQRYNYHASNTRPIRAQYETNTDSSIKPDYIFYETPACNKKDTELANSSKNAEINIPVHSPLIESLKNHLKKRQIGLGGTSVCDKCGSRKEEREFNFRYMTKPWAITSYPKHGPDF